MMLFMFLNKFTDRQIEILAYLIFTGFSVDEIARLLGISRWTAKKHVANIYDRLDVRDRDSLIYELIKFDSDQMQAILQKHREIDRTIILGSTENDANGWGEK
jgi:DNA-binding NarL/FixJ family response regulator